jgi:transcriptional regulator with XRE-family HTH domain
MDGSFADWLRGRMAERGLTQRMLALRTGISHATISRLLKGNRQPSLATAMALLSVLGPDPVRFTALLREDAS